jgi:hypothetical protein
MLRKKHDRALAVAFAEGINYLFRPTPTPRRRIPMRYRVLAALTLALLASGCGSQYGYRYQPHPQVLYTPLYADYRDYGDTIDILVDTNGMQLTHIDIAGPEGKTVDPTKIDMPQFKSELMRGIQEEIYGPERAQGPTIAHFDKAAIGPRPWRVHVKTRAAPYVTILVGAGAGRASEMVPQTMPQTTPVAP